MSGFHALITVHDVRTDALDSLVAKPGDADFEQAIIRAIEDVTDWIESGSVLNRKLILRRQVIRLRNRQWVQTEDGFTTWSPVYPAYRALTEDTDVTLSVLDYGAYEGLKILSDRHTEETIEVIGGYRRQDQTEDEVVAEFPELTGHYESIAVLPSEIRRAAVELVLYKVGLARRGQLGTSQNKVLNVGQATVTIERPDVDFDTRVASRIMHHRRIAA